MGLASAIGCEVHMVYPDVRHIMLSLLNGIYPPREYKNGVPRSILIMWSSLSGWPDRDKQFTVDDHFVPILPIEVSSADGHDCVSVWKIAKKKRGARGEGTGKM